MGLLPARRCAYSDAHALGAQPYLRTSVSNPNYPGRMKAIMQALRMVTRLMTNGLAGHSLGVWWTIWTRGDAWWAGQRAGGSGIVPQKGS